LVEVVAEDLRSQTTASLPVVALAVASQAKQIQSSIPLPSAVVARERAPEAWGVPVQVHLSSFQGHQSLLRSAAVVVVAQIL
jgi:hypothetical protein